MVRMGTDPAIRSVAAALLLAGAASAPPRSASKATAPAREGIYDAEVPVNGQGEAERNAGFARALAQVLGKLSRRSQRGRRAPAWARSCASAKDLRRRATTTARTRALGPTGAPSFRTTLVVRFDQEEVDGIAADAGPAGLAAAAAQAGAVAGDRRRQRPAPGRPARRPTRPPVLNRAHRARLPARPAHRQRRRTGRGRRDLARRQRRHRARFGALQPADAADRQALPRARAGWTADWTFVDGGKVLSTLVAATSADARRAMAAGADGAADALIEAATPSAARPARAGHATA